MANHTLLLILAVGLCALVSYDMTKAVRTGKVRGRTGTIRRATRPDAFRRYIIADAIGLALCLGVALWALAGLG